MTVIELAFFLFNAAIGSLFAFVAYSYLGVIPAFVAFPLGFMAGIGVLKGLCELLERYPRKKSDKAK